MQYLITLQGPVHFKNLPFGTVGVAVHPVVVTAADDPAAQKLAERLSTMVEEAGSCPSRSCRRLINESGRKPSPTPARARTSNPTTSQRQRLPLRLVFDHLPSPAT